MLWKHTIGVRFFVFTVLCFASLTSMGQERKSARDRIDAARTKAIKSITRGVQDSILQKKSETPFLPYEGKVIRNIIVEHIGFERSIYDTSSTNIMKKIGKLANDLHQNSREKTIRNNLFVHKHQRLNPYKLADNERYLRDLDFILDARIVAEPVNGNTDSVDLFILTRDVFALGGTFTPRSLNTYRFGLYDVNVGGRAQRIQMNGVFNPDRDPRLGYQFVYTKNSIQGSLIDATVSYTQIDNGSSLGLENEQAVLVRLTRPLVSPYTRMAGGLELSQNWSTNIFQKADTAFRHYRYNIQDAWVGYNIGINTKMENRNRHVVALRTFRQQFIKQPEQLSEQTNPLYNNKSFVLGSVTFFNQNFYKTRYVYGFGRTEDVPYGKNLTLMAGTVRQFELSRPYMGAELDKTLVMKNGDFHEYKLQAEGFWGNSELEDITLLASATLFSKLIEFRQLKVRQYLGISYTTQMNPRIKEPLTVNSDYGLTGFGADSVLGAQRLSIYSQTIVFTPLSIVGFRFAPLAFGEISMIAPKDESIFRQKAYAGIGGGLRTRNENLVFGTIELKLFWFPRVTEDLSHFRISVASNLRVKFSAGFVKRPEFIQYN
ncbi:MAG: hypothetical protein KF725_15020 [Cyclobacteriaceae bacterium]|nr:hypothetical protein [Cyclobacteriaceae bacterium]UYN87337.1 MAG: hypothetical protein KIT51_03435 [Cyclobacteriaceae bacterium]